MADSQKNYSCSSDVPNSLNIRSDKNTVCFFIWCYIYILKQLYMISH